MRLVTPRAVIRPALPALVAVAFATVLGASRAEAGCSHYVTWKGAQTEGLIALHQLSLGVVEADAGAARPIAPPPRERAPVCAGVLCSGSPAPMVPLVAPPTVSDDWGLSSPLKSLGARRHSWLRSTEPPHRPSHEGQGIFHPPRLPLA